jgi:hypothetical protein
MMDVWRGCLIGTIAAFTIGVFEVIFLSLTYLLQLFIKWTTTIEVSYFLCMILLTLSILGAMLLKEDGKELYYL